MKVLVIDAQGGGIGRQLIGKIKSLDSAVHIIAVGANSAATEAMIRAGADQAATGENPVRVIAPDVDVIAGPIGIVIVDAMLGEITPAMAEAVGRSSAVRYLIPTSHCNTKVAGLAQLPVGRLIQEAAEEIVRMGQN